MSGVALEVAQGADQDEAPGRRCGEQVVGRARGDVDDVLRGVVRGLRQQGWTTVRGSRQKMDDDIAAGRGLLGKLAIAWITNERRRRAVRRGRQAHRPHLVALVQSLSQDDPKSARTAGQ